MSLRLGRTQFHWRIAQVQVARDGLIMRDFARSTIVIMTRAWGNTMQVHRQADVKGRGVMRPHAPNRSHSPQRMVARMLYLRQNREGEATTHLQPQIKVPPRAEAAAAPAAATAINANSSHSEPSSVVTIQLPVLVTQPWRPNNPKLLPAMEDSSKIAKT